MPMPIAIIAGEPNSISSEIIFKSWKLRKRYPHRPFFIIGSVKLLNLQRKKLKQSIKINVIKKNFKKKDLKKNALPVYNVNYSQQKPFQKISTKSNKYIFKCFDEAIKFIKYNKIQGFINCPVSKETLFNKKHQGVTEFLSKKAGNSGKEVMLLYNKNLSVSPLTTHIPLNKVSKKIIKKNIIKKVNTINKFYKKIFDKKPNIGILGLNPHNFSSQKISEEKKVITPAIKIIRGKKINTINKFYKKIFYKKPNIAILGLNPHNFSSQKISEEKKVISPAIKIIRRKKIKVTGPISPDTSFMLYKKNKFDVIFGMYHDQVLTPYKALFKYNAINITLGLPYIRISPDHGVAQNIVGQNIANPRSLIESVKFFSLIK